MLERRTDYISIAAEVSQLRGAFREFKESNTHDHKAVMQKLDEVIRSHYSLKDELKTHALELVAPLRTQTQSHAQKHTALNLHIAAMWALWVCVGGALVYIAPAAAKVYNLINP